MADGESVKLLFEVAGGGGVDSGSGKIILDQIQNIVKGIESRGVTKLKFKVDTSDLKNVSTKVKQATDGLSNSNYGKGLVNYYKDLDKAADNFNKKNLNAIDYEIKARESAGKTFSSQIKAQMQTQQEAIAANDAEWKKLQNSVASKTNIKSADQSFTNISGTVGQLTADKKSTEELEVAVAKLNAAKLAFNEIPSKSNLDEYNAQKLTVNGIISNINSLSSAKQKEANQSAVDLRKEQSDMLQYRKVLAQVEAEYNKYRKNIQKNPELDNKFQTAISKLQSGIKAGNTSAFDFRDVTDARTQVQDLDQQLTETGGKVQTLSQRLEELFGIHLSTAAALIGVHALQQALQGVYQNVVELDKALVNIQIATGYTRDQTKELMSSYSQYAQQLGATTTQVASAADDWLNNIGRICRNVYFKISLTAGKPLEPLYHNVVMKYAQA